MNAAGDNAYYLIHEARYKRILGEIEKITKTDSRLRGNDKMRILDVGCYPYHLGAALEKQGHDVWGIANAFDGILYPWLNAGKTRPAFPSSLSLSGLPC